MKLSHLGCRFVVVLMLACGLASCDRVKSMLLDALDKNEPGEVAAYTGEAVKQLSSDDYSTFTSMRGHVVVVDFYADWCGPCRKLSPILEGIVEEHGGKVLLGKVNVDHNKELAAGEGVSGIPDVRIFRDGKQVDRFVGAPSASVVRERIEKQLAGLKPVEKPAEKKPVEKKPAEKKPDVVDANAEPEEKKQPTTQPMSKDWLPPGMQRR